MYVITGLLKTHQEFDRYGKAKKIEFTLSLQRVDEEIREHLQSASARNLMATFRNETERALNTAKENIAGLNL